MQFPLRRHNAPAALVTLCGSLYLTNLTRTPSSWEEISAELHFLSSQDPVACFPFAIILQEWRGTQIVGMGGGFLIADDYEESAGGWAKQLKVNDDKLHVVEEQSVW